MGPRSAKLAANRSKRRVLPRKKRPPTHKPAAKRKRMTLSAAQKAALAQYDAAKSGSFSHFCRENGIPRTAGLYHRKTSKPADRRRLAAKIVQVAKKIAQKTRTKFQSTRISAKEINNRLGKHKDSLSPRQISRVLAANLENRPHRHPIRGQPNAESTPSQMATINAHRQYF